MPDTLELEFEVLAEHFELDSGEDVFLYHQTVHLGVGADMVIDANHPLFDDLSPETIDDFSSKAEESIELAPLTTEYENVKLAKSRDQWVSTCVVSRVGLNKSGTQAILYDETCAPMGGGGAWYLFAKDENGWRRQKHHTVWRS